MLGVDHFTVKSGGILMLDLHETQNLVDKIANLNMRPVFLHSYYNLKTKFDEHA